MGGAGSGRPLGLAQLLLSAADRPLFIFPAGSGSTAAGRQAAGRATTFPVLQVDRT